MLDGRAAAHRDARRRGGNRVAARAGSRPRVVEVALVLFTRDLRVHDNPRSPRPSSRPRRCCRCSSSTTESAPRATAPRLTGARSSTSRSSTSTLRCVGSAARSTCAAAMSSPRPSRRRGAWGRRPSSSLADVSAYAADRERRLGKELDLRLVEGNFVVPPGEVAPAGKDHYEVFTPYHRAWSQVPPGAPLAAPRAIRLPPAARRLCVDSTQSSV